jgi:hypothetical protein
MEYYALILNRTYLLRVDAEKLEGRVCRGLVSVESGVGAARVITSSLAVHGNLADPASYVDGTKVEKQNRANFLLPLAEIAAVEYTSEKKWGMAYYPHDGRVFVTTPAGRREFIILGAQSGREVSSRLKADIERARAA